MSLEPALDVRFIDATGAGESMDVPATCVTMRGDDNSSKECAALRVRTLRTGVHYMNNDPEGDGAEQRQARYTCGVGQREVLSHYTARRMADDVCGRPAAGVEQGERVGGRLRQSDGPARGDAAAEALIVEADAAAGLGEQIDERVSAVASAADTLNEQHGGAASPKGEHEAAAVKLADLALRAVGWPAGCVHSGREHRPAAEFGAGSSPAARNMCPAGTARTKSVSNGHLIDTRNTSWTHCAPQYLRYLFSPPVAG